MEKQIIVNRVKDIISEILPEFRDDIYCGSTPQKKCFHIGTLENKDRFGEKNHLCFCVLFKDDKNFIPSIFCSVGRCNFLAEPGVSIHVSNLEKGVLEYISKTKAKEFLGNPAMYSEFATA